MTYITPTIHIRSKAERLFEYLNKGFEFKKDDRTYVIQNGVFGYLAEKHNTADDTVEEVVLPMHMSLDQFIRWADELTEEDMAGLSFTKVMASTRKRR